MRALRSRILGTACALGAVWTGAAVADPDKLTVKIAPKTVRLKVAPTFTHEFSAHSANLLRVKTK